MPSAAPRPCTVPGCRRLLPYKSQCPDHPPRADWKRREAHRGNRHERGYGTAWTKLRETILLRDNGLCQPCRAQGRLTVATAVDHITPKSQNGTDDPANLQAICHDCHAAKTAMETVGDRASPYPEWMPTPRIPVIVVAGPPCSGKLAYARSIATERDLVIDVNLLARSVAAQDGTAIQSTESATQATTSGTSRQSMTRALRARNTLLASLASPNCKWERAILTTTAAKPEQRAWWVNKLGATLVVMKRPRSECRGRVMQLGLPPVRALELCHLIDAWK